MDADEIERGLRFARVSHGEGIVGWVPENGEPRALVALGGLRGGSADPVGAARTAARRLLSDRVLEAAARRLARGPAFDAMIALVRARDAAMGDDGPYLVALLDLDEAESRERLEPPLAAALRRGDAFQATRGFARDLGIEGDMVLLRAIEPMLAMVPAAMSEESLDEAAEAVERGFLKGSGTLRRLAEEWREAVSAPSSPAP